MALPFKAKCNETRKTFSTMYIVVQCVYIYNKII